MELKERLKREIDFVPEEFLPQLEEFVRLLKVKHGKKRRIKTISLGGKFDNVNVRELVYE